MAAVKLTEGWMLDRPQGTRVFHYIRDMMALCRGFGFYTGGLVPAIDPTALRQKDDCARYYRKLRAEQEQAKKRP